MHKRVTVVTLSVCYCMCVCDSTTDLEDDVAIVVLHPCKEARVELYTVELICFNLEVFPLLYCLLLSLYRRKYQLFACKC